MKTITYSQTWMEELWQSEQHMIARSKFNIPEFVWLESEGYEPVFKQTYDPNRQHWVYTAEFSVPDEVLTYINLRWPDQRYEIDVFV